MFENNFFEFLLFAMINNTMYSITGGDLQFSLELK